MQASTVLVEAYLQKGYHCAEAALLAACDAWGSPLPLGYERIMAGFAGGMGMEGLCGTIVGCAAAISYYCTAYPQFTKKEIKDLVGRFVRFVEADLQSIECKDLKPRFMNIHTGCSTAVVHIMKLLDAFVQEEPKYFKESEQV